MSVAAVGVPVILFALGPDPADPLAEERQAAYVDLADMSFSVESLAEDVLDVFPESCPFEFDNEMLDGLARILDEYEGVFRTDEWMSRAHSVVGLATADTIGRAEDLTATMLHTTQAATAYTGIVSRRVEGGCETIAASRLDLTRSLEEQRASRIRFLAATSTA